MPIARWDPWGELSALQRDVSQLLSQGQAPAPARTAQGLIPPIDAYRTAEALVVTMELPGLRRDDVDVAVEDGVLTVSGERRPNIDIEDDAWVRRERPTGRFERSFTLPEGTDAQKISANFADGVLELHIPHPPERRPHRVEIQATDGDESRMVDVGSQSS